MFLFFAALVAGVGIAIYEWRKKRVLLAHDLNLEPHEDGHSLAARVHAEDVAFHRRSGFDR
ncbi:hypothetical protein [Sulfitobacter sp.]|uniref:hypothetical protein n=1 Tax=Sulfitobacter sp. TaxID=1903071 RepID=UPI003EF95DB2